MTWISPFWWEEAFIGGNTPYVILEGWKERGLASADRYRVLVLLPEFGKTQSCGSRIVLAYAPSGSGDSPVLQLQRPRNICARVRGTSALPLPLPGLPDVPPEESVPDMDGRRGPYGWFCRGSGRFLRDTGR